MTLRNKLQTPWMTATAALLLLLSCNNPQRAPLEKTDPQGITAGMVLIPEGPFEMGTTESNTAKKDETPVHRVYLKPFYIDRHEVTNRQYKKFIDTTGHPAPAVKNKSWARPYNWTNNTYPENRADYPVVMVSWHDACAYAKWAGKRLPTEAEWEKAARGGRVNMAYPFGNRLTFKQAGFNKGYVRGKKLEPAGTYPPDNFGLYDMAGNVWEWCSDWYAENYYSVSPANNPQGPDNGTYKVFRGGSWINDKKFLRCAARGKNVPEYKSPALGFRCALTPDPKTPRPVK